jgi:hypothetical protein
MSDKLIQSHLESIEKHIGQVTQLLSSPSSTDLTLACNALQAAVLGFSQLMPLKKPGQARSDPALTSRLRQTAQALAACRENLMRRAALNQGALGMLMPATRNDTYAPGAGRFARQTYGSAGRQSGEFRVTSA